MNKEIAFGGIFCYEVFPEDSAVSFSPGPEWSTFLNTVRGDEQKLHALGAFVSSSAGASIHSGMSEICARDFARAAQPPLSYQENKTFMQGAESQYALMLDLDIVRGGQPL